MGKRVSELMSLVQWTLAHREIYQAIIFFIEYFLTIGACALCRAHLSLAIIRH